MEYRLVKENKKVRYNANYNMYNDKWLGEGEECDAYLIKGQVVKFYKSDCEKERLTKEESLYLSYIDSQRILMPNDVFTDKKRRMQGYVMDYIKDLGLNNLLHLDKVILKEELQLLKKDIVILSEKKVILYDLLRKNIAFYNGIYFYDPGSYQIESSHQFHYLINIERINNCLLLQILDRARQELTGTFDVLAFNAQILDEFKDKKYPDLIEEVQEENLGEFILKKCRKI